MIKLDVFKLFRGFCCWFRYVLFNHADILCRLMIINTWRSLQYVAVYYPCIVIGSGTEVKFKHAFIWDRIFNGIEFTTSVIDWTKSVPLSLFDFIDIVTY